MFPLGWVSELKTDRARYASASSSYYRPCGFLATLGVIGLVGVLAAPTGAAAAMFTMKEDYGYGAMTGGYREKHVRKSRGDGKRGTMAGPMARTTRITAARIAEELPTRTNTAMTRIQATAG
jgi:hypothetical protein